MFSGRDAFQVWYNTKLVMHQYRVSYIERRGAIVSRHVLAKNRLDAKRIAESEGCEDILSVRREHIVRFPILSLIAVAVILVVLVVIAHAV